MGTTVQWPFFSAFKTFITFSPSCFRPIFTEKCSSSWLNSKDFLEGTFLNFLFYAGFLAKCQSNSMKLPQSSMQLKVLSIWKTKKERLQACPVELYHAWKWDNCPLLLSFNRKKIGEWIKVYICIRGKYKRKKKRETLKHFFFVENYASGVVISGFWLYDIMRLFFIYI